MADTIAIYVRQDIVIEDPDTLVAAARWTTTGAGDASALNDPVVGPQAALALLLLEHGLDELTETAAEYGLRAGDCATALTLTDPAAPAGSWIKAFPREPIGRVFHQIDTSAAYAD